jgi:hypothetical protein
VWFALHQQTDQEATGDDCYPTFLPPPKPQVICLRAPRQVVDQWLFSVDLDDLYSAPALRLTGYDFLQAEQTQTIRTRRRTGTTADWEVDSDAYFEPCGPPCSDDAFFSGEGFMLMDDSGFGHLGGPVDYKVTVPTGGNYKIWYWVGTHPNTPNATIRAQVGSTTVDTNVFQAGGGWLYKDSAPVFFPAGTYNITLSAPSGGWYLGLIIIQKV